MTTRISIWRRTALASTSLVLLSLNVPAAAQSGAPAEADRGMIEEVIVTGTAGGAEVRKFDASFAITTMSDEDISEYSPQSTADLLKLVPGVWSESSGGVAGANVFVRGFPGGGDAPFYSLQVNGAPVFPPPPHCRSLRIRRCSGSMKRSSGWRLCAVDRTRSFPTASRD